MLWWLASYCVRRGYFPLDSILYRRVLRRIISSTQSRIVSGPFQAMKYVEQAFGSALTPKLLGTYEKEVSAVAQLIVERAYARIINIGAGEGYYAVGFALHMPNTHCIAFEKHAPSRMLLSSMSQLNGVSNRVHLREHCTVERLRESILPGLRTAVICDVEGMEREILSPENVPELNACDILVELHDFRVAHVSDLIRSRFEGTHRIQCIPAMMRTHKDWPNEVRAPAWVKLTAMHEFRPDKMQWFWMESRAFSVGHDLPDIYTCKRML